VQRTQLDANEHNSWQNKLVRIVLRLEF